MFFFLPLMLAAGFGGEPVLGQCVAQILAADDHPGNRLHGFVDLACVLEERNLASETPPLWKGAAQELSTLAADNALEYDGNLRATFFTSVRAVASADPAATEVICSKPRPPLVQAHCLGAAAQGAPGPSKPALLSKAMELAYSAAGGDPSDRIHQADTMDQLVSAWASLDKKDRSSVSAGLLRAASPMNGEFPYGRLSRWAETLAEGGHEDVAAQLAAQARGSTAVDGLTPAAVVACKAGRTARGIKVARSAAAHFSNAKAKSVRDDIERIADSAAALHVCGDKKSAGVLFDRALKAAREEHGSTPATKVLAALATAGDESRTTKLLKELAQTAAKNRETSGDLAVVARTLAWQGLFPASRAIVDSLPDAERGRVFTDLTERMATVGRGTDAINLANTRPSSSERAWLLVRIANTCADHKQPCLGPAMDAAFKAASTGDCQGPPRERVVEVLARHGRVKEAVALAHARVPSTGSRTDDDLVQARILTSLARWAVAHDAPSALAAVKEALPVADRVAFADDRDSQLSALAEVAHQAGESALASDISQRMRRKDMRDSLLKRLKSADASRNMDPWNSMRNLPDDADKASAIVQHWLQNGSAGFACPRSNTNASSGP